MISDLNEAYDHSSCHRAEVEASEVCGCFYCLATFPPSKISEWVMPEGTALCPECGIDSVIGSKSGVPINKDFFGAMNKMFFAESAKYA